jgi:hypothetical protein
VLRHWVNGIEYSFGDNRQTIKLNIVTCHEEWIENRPRSEKKTVHKTTAYSWISGEKLNAKNVFSRCNEMARQRWCVESHFNVEKNNGYRYSHCFSYCWKAMMGFHYLMKIAHFINTLVSNSLLISDYVLAEGVQGFIKKVWERVINCGVEIKNPPKRRGRPVAVGCIDFRLLCLANSKK